MLQITRSGPVFSGTEADLDRLRLQFHEQNFIRLLHFLAPELLTIVHARLERAQFRERIHEGIGSNKELCMEDSLTNSLLHLLLNSQSLFQLVQAITGCVQIGSFEGRVYRNVPDQAHYDAWHDDMVEHRLIGVSINLSTAEYSGGILQIRERQTKRMIQEVTNVGLGDAIVFRLDSSLQHRISKVDGAVSKTAFAGWFKSEPEFLSLLK
ncbi:MAG: 2OG-Fe(II) oxygenase [Blastocatellia bacterium]